MNPGIIYARPEAIVRGPPLPHELAGGRPEEIHQSRGRRQHEARDFPLMIIPADFRMAIHLGRQAVEAIWTTAGRGAAALGPGMNGIGICNGFQVLVKAGICLEMTMETTMDDSHRLMSIVDRRRRRI